METKIGLFCVQEHSSKKYHYDLRVEYNGMARSWVMYKPFPQSVNEARLAIKMPAHSLKYLTKEGGNVKIVVSGSCNILSWREDKITFWLRVKTPEGETMSGVWQLEKRLKRRWMLHKLKI